MKAQRLEWTPEHVQRFWDYWSSRPDQHAHYFARQVGKGVCKFLEHVLPISGQQVLDYGAGPGFLVEMLLQRGAYVAAAEYSELGVAELNQRFHRDRFWSGAKRVEAGRLPWQDNVFDLVCCLETIEHLLPAELNSVLGELHRVVHPGGIILFTTPNAENLQAQTVFCPQCACEFHRWQHVRRWTPQTLTAHLEKLNYEVLFCAGTSLHEFQPGRFDSKDLTRFRFWYRSVTAAADAFLDHLRPLPFPHGRRFRSRANRGGSHHLVAIVSKPIGATAQRGSRSGHRSAARIGEVPSHRTEHKDSSAA